MDYMFKFSPLDTSNADPILRATPTAAGGNAKCRSFESEKDLLAFLLNFPQLRLERTSSVYLSDKKAAELKKSSDESLRTAPPTGTSASPFWRRQSWFLWVP
jgi:hypothetical protein